MIESLLNCQTGGKAGKLMNATGAGKAVGCVATAPCGLCSLRTCQHPNSSLGPDNIQYGCMVRMCVCVSVWACVCLRKYRIFDQDAPVARSFRANAASGSFTISGVLTRHVAHGGLAEGEGGACTYSDASIQDVLHVNPR